MPDTVKLPLLGPTKKSTALAGGAAIVGTVGWLVYKSAKAKKAAAATAATPATSASTYGYGAYAYGYGGSSAYGYGGLTYAPGEYYGYGDEGGSAYPSYGYGSGTTAITSNSQWITAAESALATEGYLPATVQAALGVYLAGGTLSSAQSAIVQAAIAAVGNPPTPPSTTTTAPSGGQSGSTGTTTPTGGTSTGTSGGSAVAVPNVVGYTTGAAHNAIDGAGLHAVAPPGQKDNWTVTSTQPAGGVQVPLGGSVLINASAPKS